MADILFYANTPEKRAINQKFIKFLVATWNGNNCKIQLSGDIIELLSSAIHLKQIMRSVMQISIVKLRDKKSRRAIKRVSWNMNRLIRELDREIINRIIIGNELQHI